MHTQFVTCDIIYHGGSIDLANRPHIILYLPNGLSVRLGRFL